MIVSDFMVHSLLNLLVEDLTAPAHPPEITARETDEVCDWLFDFFKFEIDELRIDGPEVGVDL